MTGTDGWPYVIPMNFGYTWDEDGLTLYFHGGVKGKKIDSLRADPRICFEMDCEEGLTGEGDLACRYSYAFSSIVGYGKVEFAKDNEEKRQGFDVHHAAPDRQGRLDVHGRGSVCHRGDARARGVV